MTTTSEFDPTKKFVRIVETHPSGLVEFEFAVGEPELFVELLMGQAEFDDFCVMHAVTPTQGRLPPKQDDAEHEWDWSLHAAREQQLRHDKKA